MSKKPKIKYVKKDELEDPWAKLKKRPGVRIISQARRKPE